jgi:DNA-binding transcriptional regulator YbjK
MGLDFARHEREKIVPKPAFTRAEPDARRQSLVEACARVLARDGAGGASVRAIATEAGVSAGLITHYFASIDALIAATYAHIGELVTAALTHAVDTAGAAATDRLAAYVAASFDPPIADPDLLATWIALWSMVGARPAIAELHDRLYARYREDLEKLLGECALPASRQRLTAIAVTALVDGLWLELCLSPGSFTAAEAKDIVADQLAVLISSAP